ncbi:MAG: hypothetical protein C7B47_15960 [Sulfobacillus thermosulfidooxidans]|uniref:Peptidase M50 domain-containing protein n=1 Tax=Sulfobacillus thermosulfidooxidans TaxID=28034 RepID=A0A2T2WM33_SULTH|nr:MAG: hypothetical protein C7B47_15960 [Sulfobacillus thermosulfidooxidans]
MDLWELVGVAAGLILLHEGGHMLATRALGGRVLGLVWRGVAVGVRLDVAALSPAAVAWTLIAGPGAAALGAGVLAAAWPPARAAVLLIGGCDFLLNLLPWGVVPNDGTRLWRWWRTGRIASNTAILERKRPR